MVRLMGFCCDSLVQADSVPDHFVHRTAVGLLMPLLLAYWFCLAHLKLCRIPVHQACLPCWPSPRWFCPAPHSTHAHTRC